MKRRRARLTVFGLAAVLVSFFAALYIPKEDGRPLCVRVVDGDTLVVRMEGKKETVRLIGVDTPETKHPKKPVEYFGHEASRFTEGMAKGKRLRLEHDRQQRDRYGRLLAYVYLEDGTFLNAEIIRRGYGFAYTKYPFRHMEDFRRMEREARESGAGLWGGQRPP